MVILTEQNTSYFKRVHSTQFSRLTYTTYNTRDKGRKEKKGKRCNKSMWRVEVIIQRLLKKINKQITRLNLNEQ